MLVNVTDKDLTFSVSLPGWIITKNENGKVKIAVCEENETNIYEKTRGNSW